MFKMYLEDVKWSGSEASSLLVFKNAKDGGYLSIEIPESVGFDLRTLLNQKISGLMPYSGVCELIRQAGGKVRKLTIKNYHKPGTAELLLEIGGKTTEIELFFADVVSASIILDLPIYFDESLCQKKDLEIANRLLWTRTESITNYSFETNS